MRILNRSWGRVVAALALLLSALTAQAVPPGSAYRTDVQTTFANDASYDNFKLASIVTCVVRAMLPEAFAGKPRYLAWVDNQKCIREDSSSSSGSDTASSQAPNYSQGLVTSAIDRESGKLVVDMLLKWQSEDEGVWSTEHTQVRVEISSGPAISPPYGTWTMDFCASTPGQEGTCNLGRGWVRAAGANVTVLQGDLGRELRGGRAVFSSPTTGYGVIVDGDSDGTSIRRFAVAPGKYLLETQPGVPGSQVCFDPRIEAAGTRFSVWENWLYDTVTGARHTYSNLGFPLRLASSGQSVGFASYWGASIWEGDGNPSVPDLSPLVAFIDGVDRQVVLQVPGGRLSRFSRVEGKVGEIQDVPLNFYIGVPNATVEQFITGATPGYLGQTLHPDAIGANLNLLGAYQGAGVLSFTGYQACQPGACTKYDFPSSVDRTLEALQGLSVYNIGGWIDGTGTGFNIPLAGVTLGANIDTTLRLDRNIEEIKLPGAPGIPSELVCLRNCPTVVDGSVSFSAYASQPVYLTWPAGARAPVFKDAPSIALTSADANITRSIQLFDAAQQSSLLCPGSAQDYCEYQSNVPSFTWSTGGYLSNFAYLTLNGQPIQPGRPLLLAYTVPRSEALPKGVDPSYAGRRMFLQSPGPGQIWFPGRCVNRDTGASQDCQNSNTTWLTDLYIPTSTGNDGTVTLLDPVTGQQISPLTQYHVKWLRRGALFARQASVDNCSGLNLPDGELLVPTFAEWRNPADAVGWNATDADFQQSPAVIEGQIQ